MLLSENFRNFFFAAQWDVRRAGKKIPPDANDIGGIPAAARHAAGTTLVAPGHSHRYEITRSLPSRKTEEGANMNTLMTDDDAAGGSDLVIFLLNLIETGHYAV